MHVSVIYALAHKQTIEELDVEAGTTADEAVHMSGILEDFPEIDLKVNKLGVYGKLVKGDQVLLDGDRVEIYRAIPRKRDAHAVDDKKARIRARKEQRAESADPTEKSSGEQSAAEKSE